MQAYSYLEAGCPEYGVAISQESLAMRRGPVHDESPGLSSRKKQRSTAAPAFIRDGDRSIGETTRVPEVVPRGHWSSNPSQSLISDFRNHSGCGGFHNKLHARSNSTMVCDGKAWKGFRGVDGGEVKFFGREVDGMPASSEIPARVSDCGNSSLPIHFRGQHGDQNMSKAPLLQPQLTPATGAGTDRGVSNHATEPRPMTPSLSHRLKHDRSILALVVSANCIFAGTEGGEILVYNLETYKRIAVILGHRSSVLSLTLSEDGQLLFSSAGDRFVNVWDTNTLLRVYSMYSMYDIGDVFCVSYSSTLNTVYLGAQNTSIQWYDLNEKDRRPKPTPILHPWLREDRFFDSLGPGGVRTPRSESANDHPTHAEGGQDLEIDKSHICQYAHYGYVYCMVLAKGLRDDLKEEVLISGGGDGAIKLWTVGGEDGAISELHKLDDGREEGDSVLSLVLDGTFLYAGRINGEVNVWDLETRQLVRNLRTKTEDVLALSFGGGYLFCAGVSGTVDKYNSQYELVSRFKAHNGRILASAFTRFQNQFFYITGGNDDTITIWNISDCVQGSLTGVKTSNEKLVQALKQFVSYETVSSDLRYQASCRKGASHLRSVFRNFGAQTTMLGLENPEWNPIILAKFKGNPSTSAQRKKILFYGHYDVIPAENEQGNWTCDPFQMEGINDYLYGRGTSDNKGPIMAAIFAVADLVSQKALDSDIIFLIEGEEESGSRGFEQAVKANKHLIGDVDWILLANSYWLDDHVPCLTYGLRGVIHATVEVKSTHPDLHSGVDGSSLLDESVKDLVALLAKLTGKNNRIEIPSFYDPILPLSKDEEALYQEITRTLIDRNPGLGDPHELAETLQRRWREASLTIHRFYTSGPDNSTIIPSVAKAAISLRLVPEQTAQEVADGLISFLEMQFEELSSKNRLTVAIDHKAEPWLGDYNNKIFQTLEEAIIEAWSDKNCTPALVPSRRRHSSASAAKLSAQPNGKANGRKSAKPSPTTSSTLATGSVTPPEDASDAENILPSPPPGPPNGSYFPSRQDSLPFPDKKRKPLYIREGGSIPAIRFLEKEFTAPAAHFPVGQASDSAHLDNERLRVTNLYKAKEVFGFVFRELPKR